MFHGKTLSHQEPGSELVVHSLVYAIAVLALRRSGKQGLLNGEPETVLIPPTDWTAKVKVQALCCFQTKSCTPLPSQLLALASQMTQDASDLPKTMNIPEPPNLKKEIPNLRGTVPQAMRSVKSYKRHRHLEEEAMAPPRKTHGSGLATKSSLATKALQHLLVKAVYAQAGEGSSISTRYRAPAVFKEIRLAFSSSVMALDDGRSKLFGGKHSIVLRRGVAETIGGNQNPQEFVSRDLFGHTT